MKINKKENRITIDVDGTLVNWPEDYSDKYKGRIQMQWYDQTVYLEPIPYIIQLLQSYKTRGFSITVHSANGWKWAKEVVDKLELEDFVDMVETKPSKYVDDTPADQWMHWVDVGKIDI